MKEKKGYVIVTGKGDFAIEPILFFDMRNEAKYYAKQVAKDVGDDYKSYEILNAKLIVKDKN